MIMGQFEVIAQTEMLITAIKNRMCAVNNDAKRSLVDNIYVRFGGQLFRQMVGIPMGTNCAPLLADLFLYSYENEFLDKLIKEGKRKLARRFNLSYRYIDDLISFNNKRFKEFISDIYPQRIHNF